MKRPRAVGKFVLCIRNEDCEDLEPRKLYLVLPDETFQHIVPDQSRIVEIFASLRHKLDKPERGRIEHILRNHVALVLAVESRSHTVDRAGLRKRS